MLAEVEHQQQVAIAECLRQGVNEYSPWLLADTQTRCHSLWDQPRIAQSRQFGEPGSIGSAIMSRVVNPTSQIAVVLSLDVSAEAAVRRLMQRVSESGVPIPPREIPPHITLAVCTGLDVHQFRPVLTQLAAETPTMPCMLAGLGAFPMDEGVIFLVPTASHALLGIEEHVLDGLISSGAEINPYFRAGSWVPHCTLTVGIPRDRMPAAFATCFEVFRPISAQLTQVALVEISPGGWRCTLELGKRNQ